MALAVSHRTLTAEVRVRTLVRPCDIYGVRSGIGTGFLRVLRVSPLNIIPPCLSILMYHLGYEQQARWWLQFRDIVSPHRHEQQASLK
jgi:hypothetical protein